MIMYAPADRKRLAWAGPFRGTRPLGLEFGRGGGPARAELNSHFRLGLQPGLLHRFHQAQPVLGRNRDEPAGEFDDVEPDITTLLDICLDRITALREHVFDEAAGGYEHVVTMCEFDDFS
jgi:hypothetical protein